MRTGKPRRVSSMAAARPTGPSARNEHLFSAKDSHAQQVRPVRLTCNSNSLSLACRCMGAGMSSFTRILPLVVASALFMEQMESTVIATSLPPIAVDFGVSAGFAEAGVDDLSSGTDGFSAD